MGKLDITILKIEALTLVKKYWGISEIPNIVIDQLTDDEWKAKAKKSGYESIVGTYWSNRNTVELNSSANNERSNKQISDTLLHELVHWRNHQLGIPYCDSDIEFARELIRVGLKDKNNSDEASKQAMKNAKNRMQYEVFELFCHLTEEKYLLKHNKKSENDFKKDLAQSYILHFNRIEKEEGDLGISQSPRGVEGICDILVENFGYRYYPLHYVSSFQFVSHDDSIDHREAVEENLLELGLSDEEIDNSLVKDTELQY
ncbi:hypothetical protein ACI2JA_03445 [Alkalihalobacillus sp. NPDC078783]